MTAAALHPPVRRRSPDADRVYLVFTTNQTALLYTLACLAQDTGTQVTSILPGVNWDCDQELHVAACKLYTGLHAAVVRGQL